MKKRFVFFVELTTFGCFFSREEITVDEKVDRDLVAVGDEKGMRDESSDDSSSENDDETGNDEQAESKRKLLKRLRAQQAATDADGTKTAADGDDTNALAVAGRTVRLTDAVDERDSSGSDTDDPDSPKSKTSVFFMQVGEAQTGERPQSTPPLQHKDRKRAASAAGAAGGDEDGAQASSVGNGAGASAGPSDAKRVKTS